MPEQTGPFGVALVSAARWKILFVVLGVMGLTGAMGLPALSAKGGLPASVMWGGLAAFYGFLGVILISSMRSIAEVRAAGDDGLSAMGAYRLWGRSAVVDAFGLIPYCIVCFSAFYSPVWRMDFAACLYIACAVACVGVHLFYLPLRLGHGLRHWTPSGCERDHGVPVGDPVRATLGRIATRRSWALLAGLCAFGLPWAYADRVQGIIPGMGSSPRSGEGPVSGWALLFSDRYRAGRAMAWIMLEGILLLVMISLWGWMRSRWPFALRLSNTRVFGSWILSLLPGVSALVMWGGALWGCWQARPILAGLWLSIAGFAGAFLVSLAFAPLLLMRALRERSETEQKAALAERDAPPA